MIRPKKLVDYPWVVVRIECVLCARKGCYRLARLAARYGPEQSLDGLLADVAHSCPWWRSNPRKYEVRCGARYVDLERNLPPPDHPDAPLHRQRQPGREDVPQQRHAAPATLASQDAMLSGCSQPTLTIACDRCGRRDTFIIADAIKTLGDLRMTDLLKRLVPDCSRVTETQAYELCRVRYELDN